MDSRANLHWEFRGYSSGENSGYRRNHSLPCEGTKQQIHTVNRSHIGGLLKRESKGKQSSLWKKRRREGYQGVIDAQDRQQRQQWEPVLSGQLVMICIIVLWG